MTTQEHPGSKLARPARAFWSSAVLAAVLVAVFVGFGLLDWVPFVGERLQRPGAAGTITASILAVALWILLFAWTRARQCSMERAVIGKVRDQIEENGSGIALSYVDQHLQRTVGAQYRDSLIRQRFLRLHAVRGEAEFAEFAITSQSSLDATLSDVSYGPARALAWSLPALGFLGTASQMAHAVNGLGASVARTTGYSDLRSFLVQSVIPPLADAFGIMLFALGATVVCYVLLVIVHAREQRILIEADSAALDLLAVAEHPMPTEPAPATISGDLDALTREVAISNDALKFLAEDGRLYELLQSVDSCLKEIRRGLDRDLVLRRVPMQGSRD